MRERFNPALIHPQPFLPTFPLPRCPFTRRRDSFSRLRTILSTFDGEKEVCVHRRGRQRSRPLLLLLGCCCCCRRRCTSRRRVICEEFLLRTPSSSSFYYCRTPTTPWLSSYRGCISARDVRRVVTAQTLCRWSPALDYSRRGGRRRRRRRRGGGG